MSRRLSSEAQWPLTTLRGSVTQGGGHRATHVLWHGPVTAQYGTTRKAAAMMGGMGVGQKGGGMMVWGELGGNRRESKTGSPHAVHVSVICLSARARIFQRCVSVFFVFLIACLLWKGPSLRPNFGSAGITYRHDLHPQGCKTLDFFSPVPDERTG